MYIYKTADVQILLEKLGKSILLFLFERNSNCMHRLQKRQSFTSISMFTVYETY